MDIKDTIKIVYNWIGPMGPIWNTEVPNLFNIAHIGEYTGTHNTTYFWCDTIWDKYFKNKKEEYILYPATELQESDIFIYPFTLTWRIPFGQYFSLNSGILEYGHTPGHIQNLVRNHNGYYLIDHSVEAFLQDFDLDALHNYFGNMGYPRNKIIYLTGCMNASEIYDAYCNRRGISEEKTERLNIIPYPYSGNEVTLLVRGFSNPDEYREPVYNVDHVPEKLFLIWNRRYRGHRVELALHLEHLKVIDKSYVSLNAVDQERPNITFKDVARSHYNDNATYTLEDIDSLSSKLPLVLDGLTDVGEMCSDLFAKTRPFYQNSLISIITETNFYEKEVTLTEKSFKPLREKHPFIIVGAKGAIKAMHELGFKTFDAFWSENYDNIEDPQARMTEIVRIINQINTWDTTKIMYFKREVKNILEYNYKMLFNTMAELLAENIDKIIRGNLLS